MSPHQLTQLGIAASAAIKYQRSIGALSAAALPLDLRGESVSRQNEFWRQQQTGIATNRVCSFKELRNKNPDEFRLVMQHFEALAGPGYKGRAVKSTVRVIENRHGHTPQGAGMIQAILAVAKERGINHTYMESICSDKFNGVTDLTLLNMHQLRELIATLRRRGSGVKSPARSASPSDAGGEGPRAESLKPQAKADEGVRAPVSKGREYVLKKFIKPSDVPSDDIPF